MFSSDSGTFCKLPLQSPQSSNENNRGIIGNGSNNFVNSGNIINSDIVFEIIDSEDVELERLLSRHVSKDALRNSFYSPPECHPNTRTTVRSEIGEWIDESGSEKSPLLWLNGPAAVGKSVIAKTISGFHDQIVATFFFSTSSDKSAATLFPTLAWQLALRIPDTRKHIIASLKSGGSPQTSQIEEQFNLLIIDPLKSTTTSRPRPVMVIDGVDECIDENMLVRFLQALVRAGKDGGMPVRFIVCSRPEPRIQAILARARDVNTTHGQERRIVRRSRIGNLFHKLGLVGIRDFRTTYFNTPIQRRRARQVSFSLLSTPLQEFWEMYRPIRLGVDKEAPSSKTRDKLRADALDRIHTSTVISTIQLGFSEECKEDIARYLTDKFNAICGPGEGTSSWFQPSDISDLVEVSCGQFLYASTIVRLLDEPHFDPRDVLEMARRNSLPTPDLNKLYKAILKRAEDTIRKQAKEGGPDCRTEWQCVMDLLAILVFFAGNVHLITMRKNFPVIEVLLGRKLTLKLSRMHSVLRIVPGESIELYHRSFLEFLQSRERSGEYHIAYSYALRRILVLMFRAGIRYNTMLYRGQSKENDQEMLKHVQCMINTFCPSPGGYRGGAPHILHFLIHCSLMFSLYVSCLFLSMRHLPSSPSTFPFMLSVTLFYLIYLGAFILSLSTYTLFFNRSIIVPFFHPFLHPLFVTTGGFFFPIRFLITLPIAIEVALGLPQWLL